MIKDISLSLLEHNTGQLPGVPANPRDLNNEHFEIAKKSLKDFPEMLQVRTLVAVEYHSKFIVIGGNQRLRAMRSLNYREAPCIIVKWSTDKICEFIIKDNLAYGEWNYDQLANEWDAELLIDWGMHLPIDLNSAEIEDTQIMEKPKLFTLTIETEDKMNFDSIKKELDRLKINYSEFEK